MERESKTQQSRATLQGRRPRPAAERVPNTARVSSCVLKFAAPWGSADLAGRVATSTTQEDLKIEGHVWQIRFSAFCRQTPTQLLDSRPPSASSRLSTHANKLLPKRRPRGKRPARAHTPCELLLPIIMRFLVVHEERHRGDAVEK